MEKAADEVFCRACGTAIKAQAEICPNCGVRNASASTPASDKNKVTAGLLAIFLGGLGIHKFYLGQPGSAVLYILFCWTIIPSIIALVEGITYLTMTDQQFAEKYPAK